MNVTRLCLVRSKLPDLNLQQPRPRFTLWRYVMVPGGGDYGVWETEQRSTR